MPAQLPLPHEPHLLVDCDGAGRRPRTPSLSSTKGSPLAVVATGLALLRSRFGTRLATCGDSTTTSRAVSSSVAGRRRRQESRMLPYPPHCSSFLIVWCRCAASDWSCCRMAVMKVSAYCRALLVLTISKSIRRRSFSSFEGPPVRKMSFCFRTVSGPRTRCRACSAAPSRCAAQVWRPTMARYRYRCPEDDRPVLVATTTRLVFLRRISRDRSCFLPVRG